MRRMWHSKVLLIWRLSKTSSVIALCRAIELSTQSRSNPSSLHIWLRCVPELLMKSAIAGTLTKMSGASVSVNEVNAKPSSLIVLFKLTWLPMRSSVLGSPPKTAKQETLEGKVLSCHGSASLSSRGYWICVVWLLACERTRRLWSHLCIRQRYWICVRWRRGWGGCPSQESSQIQWEVSYLEFITAGDHWSKDFKCYTCGKQATKGLLEYWNKSHWGREITVLILNNGTVVHSWEQQEPRVHCTRWNFGLSLVDALEIQHFTSKLRFPFFRMDTTWTQ